MDTLNTATLDLLADRMERLVQAIGLVVAHKPFLAAGVAALFICTWIVLTGLTVKQLARLVAGLAAIIFMLTPTGQTCIKWLVIAFASVVGVLCLAMGVTSTVFWLRDRWEDRKARIRDWEHSDLGGIPAVVPLGRDPNHCADCATEHRRNQERIDAELAALEENPA